MDKRRRCMLVVTDTENPEGHQLILARALSVRTHHNGYDLPISRATNYIHVFNNISRRFQATEVPLTVFETQYPDGIPTDTIVIEFKPIGDVRYRHKNLWDIPPHEEEVVGKPRYGRFRFPRCIILVKKGDEIVGLLKLKNSAVRRGKITTLNDDLEKVPAMRAKKRLYDVQARSTFPKVKTAFERDNPELTVIPQFSYDDNTLEYYEKQQRIIEYDAVKAGIYKSRRLRFPEGTTFKIILYTEIKVPTDVPNGKGGYMQKTVEFIVVDGLKKNQWADPLYTSRTTALNHAKKAVERFPHLKYRVIPIKPNTIRL